MKLFNKALIILGVAATAVACSDPLEKTSASSFEEASVFSNYDLARYSVNGIYEAYVLTSAYRSDYLYYYGANNDVEIWTDQGDNERSNMCKYRILPTNSYVNRSNSYDFYPGVYNSIERANLCIKNLRLYGDVENNPLMANLLGESLTARALLYTDLLNTYGEVPARFEPVTSATMYIPKSDRDVIYKQLLKDLLEAASLMDFKSQTTITRPGKALALGLYARLALQAAGYSRRPDDGKVNTGNEGSIRKSLDPELQKEVTYPIALLGLQQVINSNMFALFDNFEDIWHYYCNLKTTIDENGREIIFGLPFGENRGQHIALNGVPNKKYNFGASSGRKGLVPSFYFKYENFDTRRDVTCSQVRWNDNGDVDESNLKSALVYFGKFRFDWMEEHPFRAKDAEDGAKMTYMRYADIYLMAAEIANELGDLQAAKEYMRPVLKRAFQSDIEVDVYYENLTNKQEFFQAVKDQRALEFAGEMLRKVDLIRWGCLKEALDQAKEDMLALKNRTGFAAGLRDAIYWRYKTGSKYRDVEIQFVKETDPEPSGWNKKDKYLSGMSSSVYERLYIEDPDQYMYRPIPSSIINASLGSLKNDYGDLYYE